MQFFLYEIVARIVAIYLCVYCSRQLWHGLVERKISRYGGDWLDFLVDWSGPLVARRDATPVRYWILIGLQIFAVIGCFFLAIFGWQPNT